MKQYDMLLERSGADNPRIMEVWEYKHIERSSWLEAWELDKFGKDGWQLCGLIQSPLPNLEPPAFIYYFKRIKP